MNEFKVVGRLVDGSLQEMPIRATENIVYDGCRFAISTEQFTVLCCSLDKYIGNAAEVLKASAGRQVLIEGFLFYDAFSQHSSLAVATKIEVLG